MREYISFSNASAGQQATALFRTLLNEAGPPVLIDQPEEDLDIPSWRSWSRSGSRSGSGRSCSSAIMQNFVVNGDAELVAWCDYRKAGDQSGGRIAGQGAIDVPEDREAINRIMEGGEDALGLRREKYGF